MSITKLKPTGNRALPPATKNTDGRPLTGRVIFGMLTGNEVPDPGGNDVVITSAKDRRR